MAEDSSNPTPTTETETEDIFEYNKNLFPDFYICRHCHAHLSLLQDCVYKYVENNQHYAIFKNLVNTVNDQLYVITNDKTTVSTLYCVKCTTDIGFAFLHVKEEATEVKPGAYLLYMKKLLLWKNNQLLNAETNEPFENAAVAVEPAENSAQREQSAVTGSQIEKSVETGSQGEQSGETGSQIEQSEAEAGSEAEQSTAEIGSLRDVKEQQPVDENESDEGAAAGQGNTPASA